MGYEYELVTHKNISGLQVFLVDLLYRTPHIHREFELCLLLTGEADVWIQSSCYHILAGSFFLANPYQVHELRATTPAQILCFQISPGLFSGYFPQIKDLVFDKPVLTDDGSAPIRQLKKNALDMAHTYLKKEPLYELECLANLNSVFHSCLRMMPFTMVSEAEAQSRASKENKIRYLSEHIEEHCTEKLLLSKIAADMGLSLYYLSHFFIDNFGMSFQEYLTKVRCERARKRLLLTDSSILDVSISAGFSDPKYLNAAFRNLYGCTPREYRKGFHSDTIDGQQFSMLTTQEFLSEEASLVLLERFLNKHA